MLVLQNGYHKTLLDLLLVTEQHDMGGRMSSITRNGHQMRESFSRACLPNAKKIAV